MSPACLQPSVCLSGDLCTKRMNVHLVLHLHNISGSMCLSTQITTVMGKGFVPADMQEAMALAHLSVATGSGDDAEDVMLAVVDPGNETPVPRQPDWGGESGRGLQIVGALSHVWGWSPIAGHGKAVWAVLRETPS